MAARQTQSEKGMRKIWGVLFLALFLFSLLGLFSYNPDDISIYKTPPNNPSDNLIGLVGAWLSFILFTFLGVGAYVTPLWCLVVGLILMLDEEEKVWPRVIWASVMLLTLASAVELNPDMWLAVSSRLNIEPCPGGILGWLLMRSVLVKWLSPVGAGILVWSVLLAALMMLVGANNLTRGFTCCVEMVKNAIAAIAERHNARLDKQQILEKEERQLEKQRRQLEKDLYRQEREAEKMERRRAIREPVVQEPESVEKTPKFRKPFTPEKKDPPSDSVTAPVSMSNYKLPPIDLLQKSEAVAIKVDVATTSSIMVETLADFGIEVQITNVEKGPVVTRYELLPAPGVRIEKIAGLANNLALSLKAHSVRVQAPIPGKGVVGVEVPNTTAKIVRIRDVIEGEAWQTNKYAVPLALGQDVGGNDLVADLAKMPHMLVAGATGAGKTVCMNSLLAGMLMSKTPDELRLMLVDPKIVEFTAFNDLPHLVVPVITDPKKVALGLRWAINEMEKRYKLFAKAGVRNIESYNHREIVTQKDLFEQPGNGESPAKNAMPARVPYIIIVIDELADLMLVDQAEIENCVARLAQLSRAVGIHMILSTQRPSVNVITGTIKANFPSRIAFQVAQKTDSRTILDTVGAEKLLGCGDMLFLPPGASKVMRAQGAMCSDDEIKRIVDFIKAQAGPNFDVEIRDKLEKSVASGKLDSGEEDDLLGQAIDIIRETNRASTSSLQRRLRIGYTRAARMMDILEERGIIGPPRGSDPREILIDLDGEIPNNVREEEDVSDMGDDDDIPDGQDIDENDEVLVEDADIEEDEMPA